MEEKMKMWNEAKEVNEIEVKWERMCKRDLHIKQWRNKKKNGDTYERLADGKGEATEVQKREGWEKTKENSLREPYQRQAKEKQSEKGLTC